MSINIIQIAELAKIHFSDDELERMENDMRSIVELMDSIKDVELPAHEDEQVLHMELGDLREDTVGESMPWEVIVSQSPDGSNFVLPRVLE